MPVTSVIKDVLHCARQNEKRTENHHNKGCAEEFIEGS